MKHVSIEFNAESDLSIVEEVLVLEAAFERADQVYDWYIADDIFNNYDVLVMDEEELDKLVMNTLLEYGVWDSKSSQAYKE